MRTSPWINKLPTRQRCVLANFERDRGKRLSKIGLKSILIKTPLLIADRPWCGRKTMADLFAFCGLPDMHYPRKVLTTSERLDRKISKAIQVLKENGYEIRPIS